MLNRLFVWFYCLDIPVIIRITLLAAGIFLLLHRRLESRWWWKPLLVPVLLLWAAVVVCATVLGRSGETAVTPQWSLLHSYREILNGGSREILRSNFLNAVLFLPGGLLLGGLLPQRSPQICRVILGTVICLCFSVGIEYLQLTHLLGRAEIDDVLHNTLGALAGLLWMRPKDP